MNILSIPLDHVLVGERLRAVDPAYAALIAASMEEQGQQTPIEVRPVKGPVPYALVAGGHRMAALRLAGIPEALATVFEGSELQARMREIDENLIRRELSALDRATFLAQRKAVYEDLHPETRHGGDRSGQVANFATRFTADAAERLGFSERAVRLAITRHNRIAPELRARIAGTWLADHGAQLDALAKLPPGRQATAVDVLLTYPSIRSIAAALAQADGTVPPSANPEADQFDAFLRLWRRMGATVRRRVVAHVTKPEKP